MERELYNGHHFGISELWIQKPRVHKSFWILYKESIVRMLGNFSTATMDSIGQESKVNKLFPTLNLYAAELSV